MNVCVYLRRSVDEVADFFLLLVHAADKIVGQIKSTEMASVICKFFLYLSYHY